MPSKFLRIEGLIIFALATAFYFWEDEFNRLTFILLFFVPDIFMAGYLKNNKVGALIYNIGHTYTTPLLLPLLLYYTSLIDYKLGIPIALIWIAHIGLDRLLGFGLKTESSFKSTHLGSIGKS